MEVKLYSSPGCAFCIFVENFLKKHNIDYKVIDISKDESKKKEMIDKSGQENVPVTEVDEKIVVGYDLKKLKEVMEIQ